MRKNPSNTLRELSRTFAHMFNSYRPELHYMRGPGPKWHAKRSRPATTRAQADITVPALNKIAKAGA